MRSPEPRRAQLRRRRRRLAVLVGAASLLGLGDNLPARAQEAQATGEQLFGAYELEARGSGVQGRYELVGALPGGAPVLDLTLPETLARFGSGPTGYGLASLAYPGPLIGGFGALVSQGGGPGEQIPPYPIAAEAFFPAGPVEANTSQGPAVQKVVSGELGVQANGTFPPVDAPPVLNVGSLASASRTAIEGELAVSRTRVELSGITILGGVITIESLITDLVAVHDGSTGSTNGGTVASGVKFLGLDASLTEDGLVLDKAPAVEGPGAPLGGALGDLAAPLGELTAPVQDLLTEVLEQAVPQVDDVLAQAGIQVKILDPVEAKTESGAASRVSSGLSLTFTYAGSEQDALVDLVNSIPPELKPPLGPLSNPVEFLIQNHITGLAFAPASVSALATPPFPDLEVPFAPVDTLPFDPGGSVGLGEPGFTTPPAPLPPPAATATSPVGPNEPGSNDLADAVPGVLVALALLASPFFGLGSSRLADNVLAPVSTSCPIGLDNPQAPPRTS